MKKREVFMLSALSFSVGIVFGFLISPIKQGVYNIAGNTENYHYHDKKNTGSDEMD
ncbi:hypothetical protein [Lederbergia panacisoli]|uniref:hypothetical protein n=1 Tax=Lederbergia panacisoli TaxID=1255251 RepID=UPI00214B137C|nr:hypothetical protein [Lederbergia panacisoli]MCR2823884.1 hypothetical protein [Lederbergia panacisoli]